MSKSLDLLMHALIWAFIVFVLCVSAVYGTLAFMMLREFVK